jgi:sec-independent protein translocase protein TatC
MAWRPPSLMDIPMGLGDHLHELRRRLIVPLIAIGVVFIVAFIFTREINHWMQWPLRRAVQIVGFETARDVGMLQTQDEYDHIMDGKKPLLTAMSMAEGTGAAVKVSGTLGIVIALPILLGQLWRFIAVGLKEKERRLAFLFVPLGVIFFYIGLVPGYFFGVPYFFAWMIQFNNAMYPDVGMLLKLEDYINDFIIWLVSFGLVMDIPWLVMVVVRVGLVTPQKIASYRRYIVGVNIILAACITPTSDLGSLLAMFIPMQVLFEVGLLASRFMVPKKPAEPPPPVASE